MISNFRVVLREHQVCWPTAIFRVLFSSNTGRRSGIGNLFSNLHCCSKDPPINDFIVDPPRNTGQESRDDSAC